MVRDRRDRGGSCERFLGGAATGIDVLAAERAAREGGERASAQLDTRSNLDDLDRPLRLQFEGTLDGVDLVARERALGAQSLDADELAVDAASSAEVAVKPLGHEDLADVPDQIEAPAGS